MPKKLYLSFNLLLVFGKDLLYPAISITSTSLFDFQWGEGGGVVYFLILSCHFDLGFVLPICLSLLIFIF